MYIEEVIERMEAMGIEASKEIERLGATSYLEKWKELLNSYDFMRLGQAINKGKWETARMILHRLEGTVKELGAVSWQHAIKGLQQAVSCRNTREAKPILAIMIQKRVQLKSFIFYERNAKNISLINTILEEYD